MRCILLSTVIIFLTNSAYADVTILPSTDATSAQVIQQLERLPPPQSIDKRPESVKRYESSLQQMWQGQTPSTEEQKKYINLEMQKIEHAKSFDKAAYLETGKTLSEIYRQEEVNRSVSHADIIASLSDTDRKEIALYYSQKISRNYEVPGIIKDSGYEWNRLQLEKFDIMAADIFDKRSFLANAEQFAALQKDRNYVSWESTANVLVTKSYEERNPPDPCKGWRRFTDIFTHKAVGGCFE